VRGVLVDASALVALLDRGDDQHAACVRALESITDQLITVWPALTEAMHLVGDSARAQEALLDMIEDQALELASLDAEDVPRMKALMRKYRDLPMDFADAALVRVAERDRLTRIVSFDRHFRVYALPGRSRFVVLAGSPP
jgi:predicted nucleic acid-binding protein